MLSESNTIAVKMLAEEFGVSTETVIDNIITDFRARRAADLMEGVNKPLYAFTVGGDSKETAELYTGQMLYDYVVTNRRLEIQQQRSLTNGRTRSEE